MPRNTSFSKVGSLFCLLSLSFLQTSCITETDKKSNSALESANVSSEKTQKKAAKNIILFIGDGMGISTITAGRIFDGQSQGKLGEEHQLAFDKFENVALIKTYNTNAQVPDSAGTATAIMSGYKTNIRAVNVQPDTFGQGCGDIAGQPTLTDRSLVAGKAVGIITTTRITHATPAAMYAHANNRDWEADKDIQGAAVDAGCKSIAQQMVESKAELILGGGAKEFTQTQIEALKGETTFVKNKTDLMNAEEGKLRGLFSPSHMSFEADRHKTEEPSLAEMTSVAIERLSRNESGYVVMIEAGRIDHAHHGTNAYRALTDLQALNEAVKVAKAQTGNDTLIIVTADHSHGFTMTAAPYTDTGEGTARGNPILGLNRGVNDDTQQAEAEYGLAKDGKPFTTLGYQTGSNTRLSESEALSDNIVQSQNYRQQAAVPLDTETHAGEDVALFATGPGAENFKGVMEQDEIGKILASILESKN